MFQWPPARRAPCSRHPPVSPRVRHWPPLTLRSLQLLLPLLKALQPQCLGPCGSSWVSCCHFASAARSCAIRRKSSGSRHSRGHLRTARFSAAADIEGITLIWPVACCAQVSQLEAVVESQRRAADEVRAQLVQLTLALSGKRTYGLDSPADAVPRTREDAEAEAEARTVRMLDVVLSFLLAAC